MKDTPRMQHKVHRVWPLKVPPRMKVFGWLMSRNRLLTIDNLHKRELTIPNRCMLCKSNLDTIQHLFNACPYSLTIFNKLEMVKPDLMAGKSNHFGFKNSIHHLHKAFKGIQGDYFNCSIHHMGRKMRKDIQRREQRYNIIDARDLRATTIHSKWMKHSVNVDYCLAVHQILNAIVFLSFIFLLSYFFSSSILSKL